MAGNENSGNPNPDKSNLMPPWKPGQSGNPGGKTAEQRKAEVEAAELAAKAQRAMLEALADHVANDPEAALKAINADPLRLIKDAMDRAYGTATQKVGGPNGEVIFPQGVRLVSDDD